MIKQATYIKSIQDLKDAPESKPSVLLLGRSNVGKSSFINNVTRRKNLARTSNTPGKTIALNFYEINESFYMIDAPGYGYAKRSKGMKDDFIIMIEGLLLNHADLKLIIQLIDFKVGPTADDLETYQFLKSLNLPVMIITTKKDKVPKTKQYKQEKEIKGKLGNPYLFFTTSNITRENIDLITEDIIQRLGA